MELTKRKAKYDAAVNTLKALLKKNIINEYEFKKYEQKVASKYKFKNSSILRSRGVDK